MPESEAAMIIHKELSYQVVGCAQKVHSALGPGLPEAVYKKALCHELAKASIPFEEEAEFQVLYDGYLCGKFRVDILVDKKIVLELKAADAICDQYEKQALTYLKASGLQLAILMNFGEERLNSKRFAH
jgi:GxxExxY protein